MTSPRKTTARPLRLLGALLVVMCFMMSSALPVGGPPPADAHKVSCKAKKHKKARAACVKRASRHRQVHVASLARVRTAANLGRCSLKRKCVTAPVPPTTVDPAPAPAPAPAPVVSGSPITTWRAPGSTPLSDAEAAQLVRPAAETRPGNAGANSYRPTAAELDAFRNGQVDRYGRTAVQYNPLTAYVTGGFSGSTDDILQWVARKWGIPEDIVRSVAINESSWNMSQLGDRRTVTNPSGYPAQARISGTSDVYESMGIMQVRWSPQGLHQGTEPLRWKATAFNADYWGSVVRYYFDGLCYWCGPGYAAGQAWASIGAWYNPDPWLTGSLAYVDSAKSHMLQRPWAQAGF